MTTAAQQVRAQALEAAARLLKTAADYAAVHIDKPLFKKTMRQGRMALLVRLDWPGALRVFDPATGELLVESLPGNPYQLAPTMANRINAR
jgi:hypothetical protein